MPLQIGGSDANVSVSNTITTTPNVSRPDSSQTVKGGQAASNGATLVTVYTPTAATTFYAQYACISNNQASAYIVYIYASDGTTVLQEVRLGLNGTTPAIIPLCGARYTTANPPKMATQAGAAANLRYSIWGVEE